MRSNPEAGVHRHRRGAGTGTSVGGGEPERYAACEAAGADLAEVAGGRLDPEGWTHGSSAQRQTWFRTGYGAADIRECDTFAADAL